MRNSRNMCFLSVFFFSILSFFVHAAPAEFINIGSGSMTGVYYPAGASICQLIAKEAKKEQLAVRCAVESTGGSVFNLNAIENQTLEFAFAQSDWQYHSYMGSSLFAARGPDRGLRAIFSLYNEPFTIVARKNANIKNFDDLVGKRINVGEPGSGQRGTLEVLMRAKGLTMFDFKLVTELKPAEQAKALCDNQVDAFLYAVGHPAEAIHDTAAQCPINLVSVQDATVERLIAQAPFYAHAVIPAGLYEGVDTPTYTFGVKATLVTHEQVSTEHVYLLVKSVFDHFESFKKMYPTFNGLTPEKMLQANTAPYHPGAEKYYQEQGWIK